MGKQIGAIKISGLYDELSLYKSGDEALARRKSSLTRNRVLEDQKFVRTRENAADFRTAVLSGKLIRQSAWGHIRPLADNKLTARMNKFMKRVLKADVAHLRGQRRVQDGSIGRLKGFEFNCDYHLSDVLRVGCGTSINAETGNMYFSVPSFIPARQLAVPEGATHFRIVSDAAALDFENDDYSHHSQETAILLLDDTPTALFTFQHKLTPQPGHVLLLMAGIGFYRPDEEGYSRVKGGAMAVKRVERVGA